MQSRTPSFSRTPYHISNLICPQAQLLEQSMLGSDIRKLNSQRSGCCSCVCALLGQLVPIFHSSLPTTCVTWAGCPRVLKAVIANRCTLFTFAFTPHMNWESWNTSCVLSPSRWLPGLCSKLCQQSRYDLGSMPAPFWASAFPSINEGDPSRTSKEWSWGGFCFLGKMLSSFVLQVFIYVKRLYLIL